MKRWSYLLLASTLLAGLAGCQPLQGGAPTIAPEITPMPTRTLAPPLEPGAPREDSGVRLPAGYRAELYAVNLQQPTAMAFGPDRRLYVTQLSGEVVVIDGPGAAPQVYVSGLKSPLGIAWRQSDLYVLSQGTLSMFPASGATAGTRRDLLTDIPSAGMQNNNLVLGQDDWLYMGIGSLCDHCQPDNGISGQIRRIRPDGSDWQTYATGVRNPFGLTVAPDGGLWNTDNGREGMPEGLPPEELNLIEEGGDYGWPRCYGDRLPDPDGEGTAQSCQNTIPPVATFEAHTSPVGLTFYTGNAFAPEDNLALFVGLAGSWDRTAGGGKKIMRVSFSDGGPPTVIEWSTGWERPIALLTEPAGGLLVADLDRGTITRIVWSGR